jgi:hypothetical protein
MKKFYNLYEAREEVEKIANEKGYCALMFNGNYFYPEESELVADLEPVDNVIFKLKVMRPTGKKLAR